MWAPIALPLSRRASTKGGSIAAWKMRWLVPKGEGHSRQREYLLTQSEDLRSWEDFATRALCVLDQFPKGS